jgi:hypothetical protein
MGRPVNNIMGQRFGSFVVVDGPLRSFTSRVVVKWLCRCDCGAEHVMRHGHLLAKVRHGCVDCHGGSRATHRMSRTPTYVTWAKIKNRCLNKADRDWPDYGGRGITVCDRWKDSFENFLADVGEKPSAPGLSIDRIDNNRGYEPGNVRWATATQQSNNRRPRRDRRGA